MATKKTTTPTKKAVTPKSAAPAATPSRKVETAPKKTSGLTPKKAAPAASPAASAPEKKVAPAKKPRKAAPTTPAPTVSPEERWQMISEAAYFMAEKRGFSGGNPCDDWIQAEMQVDARLKQGSSGK